MCESYGNGAYDVLYIENLYITALPWYSYRKVHSLRLENEILAGKPSGHMWIDVSGINVTL